MSGAVGELRRIWTNDNALRFAVVFAIVVTGLDVVQTVAYALTQWLAFDDVFFGWRFYVVPVVRSLIIFGAVCGASLILLGVIARRSRERSVSNPE
jgi:hypothetical protein